LTDQQIASVAEQLWTCELTRTPVTPLTDRPGGFSHMDAYPVQEAVAELRQGLGHRLVGKKVGLTSPAMQAMAGIAEPDYGHLFDVMSVQNGGVIRRELLIAPKVEPELAFVLARDLAGSATPALVLAATEIVVPALEVVDSRIVDWRIRWADTVADNGSSARFVLAQNGFTPLGRDLGSVLVRFTRNGVLAAEAPMSEVLGNPLRAVCWLAHKLDEHGIGLHAGDVVLAGTPCRAADANAGDTFSAEFTGMGTVSVSVQ
jgi:2-keto-4-pentenoate hydratase